MKVPSRRVRTKVAMNLAVSAALATALVTPTAEARAIELWPAHMAKAASQPASLTFNDFGIKVDLDQLPLQASKEIEPLASVEDNPCDPYFGRVLKLRLDEEPNHPLRAWFPVAEPVKNGHRDKVGNWVDYEVVPRRPERPEYYAAYVYPVAQEGTWGTVASGFDLDVVNEEQRRGTMNAVGHGGVDLPQVRGAPIRMLPLEAQVGDARVVFIGQLMGNTVITQHTLREGTGTKQYLAVFGHLDESAPELFVGKRLRRSELVGYVGNSDSPNFVHLHYEIRRLRDGINPMTVEGARLITQDTSVPVDPRNVLPLKQPYVRREARKCSMVYSQLRTDWADEWKLPSIQLRW